MKSNYANKMQTTPKQKFAELHGKERDRLKQKHQEHRDWAFRMKQEPMPWYAWIDREGY